VRTRALRPLPPTTTEPEAPVSGTARNATCARSSRC
jgi:hypothetical protein